MKSLANNDNLNNDNSFEWFMYKIFVYGPLCSLDNGPTQTMRIGDNWRSRFEILFLLTQVHVLVIHAKLCQGYR